MPWGRVDDDFYDHPKVTAMPVAVRNAACGLYWRAVSYSNRYLTDGRLSETALRKLDATPEAIAALSNIAPGFRAGLFEKCPGMRSGYRVHDFLERNKSRAQVEAERIVKSNSGRLGGVKSGESRRAAKANGKQPASPVLHEADGQQSASSEPPKQRSKSEAPGVELPSRPVPLKNSPIPPQAGARPRSRRKTGDTPRAKGTSPRQLTEGSPTIDAKAVADLSDRVAAWNAAHPNDPLTAPEPKPATEAPPDKWLAGGST